MGFAQAAVAPSQVQSLFSKLDSGWPPTLLPGMLPSQSNLAAFSSAGSLPGAVASQARQITTVNDTLGSHTLYVSPTQAGGFCFDWSDAFAACDRLGTVPLALVWAGGEVGGSVASAFVSSVKIVLRDGTTDTAAVSWLSSPINAGFFLYRAPAGSTPVTVEGYNASGTLVARQSLTGQPYNASSPPPFAVTSSETSVATGGGQFGVYTAPSLTGGTCAWVALDGSDVPLYGDEGCLPSGYAPDGFRFRFVQVGAQTLFVGAASSKYAGVVLQFGGGERATVLPVANGLLVYLVPSALIASPGRVRVTGFASSGLPLDGEAVSVGPAS
jgi:hypothetical protein